ncbi:MAG TPA: hypothetical protein VNR39_17945 [Pseudolabrys sp.]|nr:hypothetical protein [Pseudolabrys sp.]
MAKIFKRTFRAGARSFAAIALAAGLTTILLAGSQSAFAASAAKPAPVHERALQARAQAPSATPPTVICAKSGCTVLPPDCHGAPAPGLEPGYQMLVCP